MVCFDGIDQPIVMVIWVKRVIEVVSFCSADLGLGNVEMLLMDLQCCVFGIPCP